MSRTVVLTAAEARNNLISHLGLARTLGDGARATRAILERLRCIQLDPLDVIGTNADLVVMARADGVGRGDVLRHLLPRYAFEHFAKERCLLPAAAFPWYREHGHQAQAPWWRHHERLDRVPAAAIDAVLAEVRDRGPVSVRDLADHGAVEPLDWSGWKGTSKATTMALEILWTRCDIVVAGRTDTGTKLYDVPERALGAAANRRPAGDFARWALVERVRAAGLLSRASGSSWSMLNEVRKSPAVDEMFESGELVAVTIEGSPRPYLAVPEFLSARPKRFDNRVRILGPLDPLLWDRDLVKRVFNFDYVWEVYKPAAQRRWGWYVCPLLFRDQLIGRLDARIEKDALVVKKLWIEREIDEVLIREALERHANACGCRGVTLSKRAIRVVR